MPAVSLATCPTCGSYAKPLKRYVLTAYVQRRHGKVSPMTSLPMDRAAADKEAFELRALGYRVEIAEVAP